MDKPKADNLTWHNALIGQDQRESVLAQKGCVIWLTGLSGSGKSTIARALEKRLVESGRLAYVLDGDNVRHGLNADLGFAADEREENIRRIAEVAALFANAGVLTITSFISPYRAGRDLARSRVPAGRFVEVHLDVGVDECERRDPKGLYAKARAGEIDQFTGVSAPYEEPLHPELRIKTANCSVDEAVEAIWNCLQDNDLLSSARPD